MRRFVDTMNIVVAVMAGFTLIIFKLNSPYVIARVTSVAGDLRLELGFLVGLAIVALNIILAISEFKQGGFRRNLEVSSEDGHSTLSITALERQLLSTIASESDVIDPHVNLTAHGEGVPISCHAEFKLKRQDDVLARLDVIKKHLREAFLRIIPNGVGIEVSANVVDIVSENTVKSSSSSAGQSSSEFRGPDYSSYESDGISEADEVRG
ncbi:MAG: hypothetical protein JXR97_06560 [Planctomycetes bacterium]|nr:hypothetical protein [Planctomycetota bacterium]